VVSFLFIYINFWPIFFVGGKAVGSMHSVPVSVAVSLDGSLFARGTLWNWRYQV
jgi:hypothetical protein